MTAADVIRIKELLPTSLGSDEIREQIAREILQRSSLRMGFVRGCAFGIPPSRGGIRRRASSAAIRSRWLFLASKPIGGSCAPNAMPPLRASRSAHPQPSPAATLVFSGAMRRWCEENRVSNRLKHLFKKKSFEPFCASSVWGGNLQSFAFRSEEKSAFREYSNNHGNLNFAEITCDIKRFFFIENSEKLSYQIVYGFAELPLCELHASAAVVVRTFFYKVLEVVWQFFVFWEHSISLPCKTRPSRVKCAHKVADLDGRVNHSCFVLYGISPPQFPALTENATIISQYDFNVKPRRAS